MAVLSSQKREEARRNVSFRRRPRKSSKPCRARTNSVADQFPFWPFLIEETEVPRKLHGEENKGEKMVLLALPNLDRELPSEKSCGKLHGEFKTSQESRKIKIISRKELAKAKDQVFPPPSAQLPVEFKNYTGKLGATGDPVLVIEKRLFPSDVSAKLHRLSIPVKQVVNHEFLTEEERKIFNNGNKQEKIDAILVEPSPAESKIKFKKWYINDSGTYIFD